ncbi:hypothetical protein BGZ98_002493 [Dissophora globulifera]|nr:hypothetical protein BGZ98_002493 [Dissophora globulifera]
MNHKSAGKRNPGQDLPTEVSLFALQQGQQDHTGAAALTTGSGAGNADRLLAAILVYYQGAIIDSPVPLQTLPCLHALQAYWAVEPSLAPQHVAPGSTDLERRSATIAMSTIDSARALPLVDQLFYAIVGLTRPSLSFKDSIEFNARAIFNVMIASILEGSQVHDCERLLRLCIHLKDTEDRYPLRSLAGNICLDIVDTSSLPLFARTSVLRFILSSADFILHNLETRIAMTERISRLLQENAYDDIEWRSMVQRVARKLGLRRETSAYEQSKFRCYRYLDLVVTDPIRYCRQKAMTECMPVAQWKSVLDQDFVVQLYLDDHHPSMLLFMDVARTMGITLTFPPTPFQDAILGTSRTSFANGAMVHLSETRQRLYAAMDSPQTIEEVLDAAVGMALDAHKPTAGIQACLTAWSKIVLGSIPDPSNLTPMLEFSKKLLQSSIVAPIQLVPRILCISAVCLRTCAMLQETKNSTDPKIREVVAFCLDVFLGCVLYRDEPRFGNSQPACPEATVDVYSQRAHYDIKQALLLFALLFPAGDAFTWTRAGAGAGTGEGICAEFLLQLVEHLVPLLERHVQAEWSRGTLIAAGLALELLSLQIPPAVLMQEKAELVKALDRMADVQRDSTLSASSVWSEMSQDTGCAHALPSLQSRLDLLEDYCD